MLDIYNERFSSRIFKFILYVLLFIVAVFNASQTSSSFVMPTIYDRNVFRFNIADFIVFGLFVSWILSKEIPFYRIKLLSCPLYKGFVLWIVAIVLSYTISICFLDFRINKDYNGLHIIRYLITGMLLFLVTYNIGFSKRIIEKYVWFFLFMVFCVAIYYLCNYILGPGLERGYLGKVTLNSGNLLNGMSLSVLLLFSYIVHSKGKKQLKILIAIIMSFFLLTTVFLSLVRSFIGGMIIGVGVLIIYTLVLNKSSRKFTIIITIMLVISILFTIFRYFNHELFDIIGQRIKSINFIKYNFDDRENPYTSANSHIWEIKTGIYTIKKSPIIGIGFVSYFDKSMTDYDGYPRGIHSEFLYSWARLGIIGLFANLFFYFIPIAYFWRRRKNLHWIQLGVLCWWVSLMIVRVVAPPFYTNPALAMLYFVFLSFSMNPVLIKSINGEEVPDKAILDSQ